MKIDFISGPIPDTSPIDAEEFGRAKFIYETRYNIGIDGVIYSFLPGIVIDYASIPRFLWRLYNPTDIRYQAASAVHDPLYCAGTPKKWADEVLGAIVTHRMTLMAKGNKFGIWNAGFQGGVMKNAVIVFGGGAYKKNSDEVKKRTLSLILRDGQPIKGW